MRRSLTCAAYLVFAIAFGGMAKAATLEDCTKDTAIDKIGDWFGNIGKKNKTKQRNIAARKKNRRAACLEKQTREVAPSAPQTAAEKTKA